VKELTPEERAAPGGLQTRPPVPLGERRQVTFMFCDLAGSTRLSERMDPDDLRDVLHAYFSSCCKIIEDAGGFTANLVGDGILAYFGYPTAREDAAECAVRASLRIVESLAHQPPGGAGRLEVHIGLATGMAVIADMVGEGFTERHTATGLTPNLAARIEALAEAGSVLVSDETRRLAGGLFTYADMGWHRLRGLERPVRLWRVTGESPAATRFEAQRRQSSECVGRDAELAVLMRSWRDACAGHRSIVTVRADAGLGKSRLLRTAVDALEGETQRVVLLQCSPHQAATPLHPVIAWIRREAGLGAAAPDDAERIGAWLGEGATPHEVALVAHLLGLDTPHQALLAALPPDRRRALACDLLVRFFGRHGAAAPVLFMVEDAHWMDGATEELLRLVFARLRGSRFAAWITSRPPEQRDWQGVADRAAAVQLQPLSPVHAEQVIHNACHGRRLSPASVSLILSTTDGVPLFIEEMTAAMLETGAREDASALRPGIPWTLRDGLMARLERLDGTRDVARMASALGREFTFRLLQQVTGHPPAQLRELLGRLVEAQLLFRRGEPPAEEYVFKHALIQQAAYEGQVKGDRQALHARIVAAIEAHQPDLAAREPGLMAHHCHEAGLARQEVDYLYAAGLASTRMVAIAEALTYFTRAHEAVQRLAPTPDAVRRHIDILLGLMEVGRFAILPSRVMQLATLARELAATEGVHCDAATMSAILFQEGRAHLYSSRYTQARRIFTQIRQLGRDAASRLIEMKPASALSMNLCCQGLFNETLAFIHEGNIGHYKGAGSFIDYLSGLGWIGYASCQMTGEAGLRAADLSVSEAQQMQSPIYVGGARIWRSHALMALRRFDEAVADARECVELSEQHAVPYLGWHGRVFLALCLCRAGRLDEAAAELGTARALLASAAGGEWSLLDYLPAIEAEIACFRGDFARAMAAAAEAIALAQSLGGYFAEAIAWRAEALSRVATGSDPAAAQAAFDRAVALYERGGARAEQAFSTLLWAHALQRAGHAGRARDQLRAARAQAWQSGFDLARCEQGAAVMLEAA
jgi:class 3 adenylate cyclase/tetratricopeptide (TPR) repeat protein